VQTSKMENILKTFLIIDNDLTFSERVTEKLTSINKLLQNTLIVPFRRQCIIQLEEQEALYNETAVNGITTLQSRFLI
jgi:hypothetical protein